MAMSYLHSSPRPIVGCVPRSTRHVQRAHYVVVMPSPADNIIHPHKKGWKSRMKRPGPKTRRTQIACSLRIGRVKRAARLTLSRRCLLASEVVKDPSTSNTWNRIICNSSKWNVWCAVQSENAIDGDDDGAPGAKEDQVSKPSGRRRILPNRWYLHSQHEQGELSNRTRRHRFTHRAQSGGMCAEDCLAASRGGGTGLNVCGAGTSRSSDMRHDTSLQRLLLCDVVWLSTGGGWSYRRHERDEGWVEVVRNDFRSSDLAPCHLIPHPHGHHLWKGSWTNNERDGDE